MHCVEKKPEIHYQNLKVLKASKGMGPSISCSVGNGKIVHCLENEPEIHGQRLKVLKANKGMSAIPPPGPSSPLRCSLYKTSPGTS